jgi:hypothetical protein
MTAVQAEALVADLQEMLERIRAGRTDATAH